MNPLRADSARSFTEAIDRSLEWVRRKGRFTKDEQRDRVVELFLEGRGVYERLQKGE
jgi:hypothetical protein